ncbi:hypothetical protein MRX96_048526 [Rhipicephalus microplus]
MPTASSTTPAAAGGGQVLEVLGLADGLAPNEVEQQLEPLLRLGAQLKRVGTSPSQLLVCFDSAAAAQGALLMAGLPFQLRPLPTVASSSTELLPPTSFVQLAPLRDNMLQRSAEHAKSWARQDALRPPGRRPRSVSVPSLLCCLKGLAAMAFPW